jgi:hypothetical protein
MVWIKINIFPFEVKNVDSKSSKGEKGIFCNLLYELVV